MRQTAMIVIGEPCIRCGKSTKKELEIINKYKPARNETALSRRGEK